MTDGKKDKNETKELTRLNPGELKEVKGGLPYEMPILIELSDGLETCGVGHLCSGGSGTSCLDGSVCSQGESGPSPDQFPI